LVQILITAKVDHPPRFFPLLREPELPREEEPEPRAEERGWDPPEPLRPPVRGLAEEPPEPLREEEPEPRAEERRTVEEVGRRGEEGRAP
jgi:hypothetical protein